MNYASQLDLDLSALPLDDFETAGQDLTVESLTAGQTMGGRFSPCGCASCNPCGPPPPPN